MSDQEDDIILSELNDEDLVAQMFDDLYDGLKEEIEESVIACKFISDRDEKSEELGKIGIQVKYVGEMISNYIKEGYVPMVW